MEREAVAGGGGGLAQDDLCGSNLEHGVLVATVWGEECGNSKGTQTGWRWGRAVLCCLCLLRRQASRWIRLDG
jgi:hypothetical protein